MRKLTVFLVVLVVVLVQVLPVSACFAWPSSDFYEEDGDIFDDWRVCRTSSIGEEGYLQEIYTDEGWPPASFWPALAFESLGEYIDTAYKLGEQFADKYPDYHQRAEKIFEYVRDRIQYTPDIDWWHMGEYAQNADEVANTIQESGIAYADCEEFATLLAVMYLGAGYRSAIVDCPRHVGVVVYLPDYQRANVVFELYGEPGWIWAEATAKTNPFGWFPQGQLEGTLLVYEISSEEHLDLCQPPDEEELPPEPERCSPICDAEDITLTPNFSWSVVPGATGYEIDVATNEDFDPILASGTASINAWDGIPQLEYGTTYYWRVRAVEDGVVGAWTYCLFSTEEAPPEEEELPPEPPVTGGGLNPVSIILPVIVVLALVGIIILLRRKRSA